MATSSKKEEAIRKHVAAYFGRKDIPDLIWDHPYTQDNLNPVMECWSLGEKWEYVEEELETLIGVLEDLLPLHQDETHSHSGRGQAKEWDGRFNKHEELRTTVLREHLARIASDDWPVRRFRYKLWSTMPLDESDPQVQQMRAEEKRLMESYQNEERRKHHRKMYLQLTGRPLTEDEAKQFLMSEATPYLSRDQFKE